MAQEARVALQVAHRFTNCYETSRPRLWYPRFSLAWLGVPPGPYVSDDPNAAQSALLTGTPEDVVSPADNDYEAQEWRQGLREHAFGVDVRRAAIKTARMSGVRPKDGQGKGDAVGQTRAPWDVTGLLECAWANAKTLKLRMRLWRIHRSIRHSSHLRHAIKNACGVAFLSFPAFLPAGSAGRRWFTDVHGQWLVIR